MSESAKNSTRTISGLLHVVAFRALIYFRMKLLLGPGMTIGTGVPAVTVPRLSPFFSVFYIGARRAAIFIFSRGPSFIFAIVILWTGVTLTAKTGRTFAGLSFVRRQNIISI